LLIVVNKGPRSKAVQFPVSKTGLQGCTIFDVTPAAHGSQPQLDQGNLRIEEAAESLSIYEVR
jgi:hypothetical protein